MYGEQSRPSRGAWIETSWFFILATDELPSRPSRARGLKHDCRQPKRFEQWVRVRVRVRGRRRRRSATQEDDRGQLLERLFQQGRKHVPPVSLACDDLRLTGIMHDCCEEVS